VPQHPRYRSAHVQLSSTHSNTLLGKSLETHLLQSLVQIRFDTAFRPGFLGLCIVASLKNMLCLQPQRFITSEMCRLKESSYLPSVIRIQVPSLFPVKLDALPSPMFTQLSLPYYKCVFSFPVELTIPSFHKYFCSLYFCTASEKDVMAKGVTSFVSQWQLSWYGCYCSFQPHLWSSHLTDSNRT